MQSTAKNLALALVVIVVVTSSFFAGYGAALRSETVGVAAAPMAAPAVPTGTPQDLEKQFNLFWEAWNAIDREFYDRKALDNQKRTYGAITGMVEALGDPHTAFASPVQSSVNEGDLKGSFDGIGVTVEMIDRMVVVVAPLPDTPGEKAGIRAGDVIVGINDEKTEGLSLTEAVSRIRGPRGTEVKLTIYRQGLREPLNISVTRSEIKVASVSGEMVADDVAYIRITSFTESTTKTLVDTVRRLQEQHPRALILDLRNDPGGLLQSSLEVSSIFQKNGVLLYEEDKDGKRTSFSAQRMPVQTDLPMVVLVNRGSASASEIVAGALKDTGRAKLIGQRTFGKGSVQTIRELSDGSTLRITIAHFFTPSGADINQVGIEPDIAVEITDDDRKAGQDPQMEAAVKAVKELVAAPAR